MVGNDELMGEKVGDGARERRMKIEVHLDEAKCIN